MKSKRILGFLIPAFIAALIYGYLQMPQQKRIPQGNDKPVQRSSATKNLQATKTSTSSKEGYPRLRTDLLERKAQPYPGVRRNLFTSTFVVEQRGEEFEPSQEEPVEVIAPPVVPIVPPPPSPQEMAQKELTSYKFLGFFKKGEKKTIFLSTEGDEILLVRKGEYLGRDRKYYVVNITDTTLELRKEGAGDFLIKLTDQKSLSAVPIQTMPTISPATPNGQIKEQDVDQPEALSVPEEVQPNEDQPQPEEDNQ